jgi:hypothetical protein
LFHSICAEITWLAAPGRRWAGAASSQTTAYSVFVQVCALDMKIWFKLSNYLCEMDMVNLNTGYGRLAEV